VKYALIASLLWPVLWGAAFQEDEQKPPLPTSEYIVIFNIRPEPCINARLIITARTEGEAVMLATRTLIKRFQNNLDVDSLDFVEVALKPERKR